MDSLNSLEKQLITAHFNYQSRFNAKCHKSIEMIIANQQQINCKMSNEFKNKLAEIHKFMDSKSALQTAHVPALEPVTHNTIKKKTQLLVLW